MVKIDMWSHFGHAYITKIDEGEKWGKRVSTERIS